MRALKAARSPLATKAHYIAWERPICYEAWHCHSLKGLQFTEALLILLHDKFGRHVSIILAINKFSVMRRFLVCHTIVRSLISIRLVM